ncbi:MAG: hypothetical protein IIV13_07965 [Bacteroidaceae bacterium]|nr:hypothetical protein [Bacteroidaceae bacterium]
MNTTEIKIPCVAVGSKTEQLIRDAVEMTRENNVIRRKLKMQIFSATSQLERGTNKFNTSLYKSIMNYGASKKHFPNWAWKPSDEELLEIFNRAYHIATIAINTEVPLDRWGDFWDMASIWIELDPETAAWEGYSHQRNLSALHAIYAMVHAIVDREKDKSEFIEDFLDTIRTDETINEAMEFFLPADKQPNTTATPPSSTTETETEEENRKSLFWNIIQYKDPQTLLERLHQLIDGKKGADVGCVLLKCKQDGYITRKPTQAEFKSEFELNGTWAAIHKYMGENSMNALDRANKVIIFE